MCAAVAPSWVQDVVWQELQKGLAKGCRKCDAGKIDASSLAQRRNNAMRRNARGASPGFAALPSVFVQQACDNHLGAASEAYGVATAGSDLR